MEARTFTCLYLYLCPSLSLFVWFYACLFSILTLLFGLRLVNLHVRVFVPCLVSLSLITYLYLFPSSSIYYLFISFSILTCLPFYLIMCIYVSFPPSLLIGSHSTKSSSIIYHLLRLTLCCLKVIIYRHVVYLYIIYHRLSLWCLSERCLSVCCLKAPLR